MPDMVNKPPHYNGHPAGIQAIDVIRHATHYSLGTAMKYIWRVMWGGKGNDRQDIQKAIWYLTDWLNAADASRPTRTLDDDPYEEMRLSRPSKAGMGRYE